MPCPRRKGTFEILKIARGGVHTSRDSWGLCLSYCGREKSRPVKGILGGVGSAGQVGLDSGE